MNLRPARLPVLVLALLLHAGPGTRNVNAQSQADKLKPIDAVPQTTTTPTLIVQIKNVQEGEKSQRNSVALLINSETIKPSRATPREYVFELPLAAGIYKIEAVYNAHSFWKDKTFKITTHDGRVRIYPNYCTRLAITLEKKPDGTLLRDKNFFSEMPQSLLPATAPAAEQRPASPPPAAAAVLTRPGEAPKLPETQSASAAAQPQAAPLTPAATTATARQEPLPQVEREQPGPEPCNTIALQINTSPSNADVIVDSKFLGQSPVTAQVERGQDHVVQISKEGYAAKIKLINHQELSEEKVYFLIEKLEAQK